MPEIEIVNGPLQIYWAPVGESFPAVSASPAGNWVLLGTSGAHNYSEDGVSLRLEKNAEVWRGLGSPYPRKAFISEADTFCAVTLADYTLAQMRTGLNQNTVTSDTGFDYIELDVGLDVNEIALLVRGTGKSALFAGSNMQYELNRVFEEGSRDLQHVKGEPAMAELTFRVIYDEGNPFPGGRLVEADA